MMLHKLALILVAAAIMASGPKAEADQADTQARAGSERNLKTRHTEFLKPLNPRLVLPGNDPLLPRFCARSARDTRRGVRCPPIVSNGGVGGGGIPQLELPLTARLPNVRVSFFIQEISNEVVANGGVETEHDDDDLELVTWLTTGSEADAENGGPYGWSLPGPGQTYDNFGPHGGPFGLMIYDALVFGACGSLTSFDVQHEATITESGDDIGSFVGVDNTTINSTGYYNLNYAVRATDSDGGVSDFHFSGKANVICSGLNALP